MKETYIQYDCSTELADLISSNLTISQMRRTMFHVDDIYSRVPKLSFALQNSDKESIYSKLKHILESYKGNVSWTLQYPKTKKHSSRKLYVIIPLKIANMGLLERGFADIQDYNKNTEIGFLGDEYEDFCKQAINDVKHLSAYIKSNMDW